jgi:hypothetical protein
VALSDQAQVTANESQPFRYFYPVRACWGGGGGLKKNSPGPEPAFGGPDCENHTNHVLILGGKMQGYLLLEDLENIITAGNWAVNNNATNCALKFCMWIGVLISFCEHPYK